MSKVFISDLFGVFLRYRNLAHDEAVLKMCSASHEDVGKFFKGPEWEAYGKGLLGNDGFERALREQLGYRGTVGDFGKNFFQSVSLDREFYDFFQELRVSERGWEFWLLSNVCPIFLDLAKAKYPGIFSSCVKTFLSCEMGLRKPEPQIFEKVKKDAKKDSALLFLDDFSENIAAAEAMGIRGILYEPGLMESGAKRLRVILRGYGMYRI